MILAGDIGGTNIRLALFEERDGRLERLTVEKYRIREFTGLEAVVQAFLAEGGVKKFGIEAAGFGIAGPVRNGRCSATNFSWRVDAADLRLAFGFPRTVLVNDIVASGTGLAELPPSAFAVLAEGVEDPEGNAALVSPGTGLGEGFLVRNGDRLVPYASEGGHASFAPRDEEEFELFRVLQAEHGHVSYERILSGPGLSQLYRFERLLSGEPEPEWLTHQISERGDSAPVVSTAALTGLDPVCDRTLRRFVSILGSEAGNLALKVLATSGVYLGGGIPLRILPRLLDGAFLEAFRDKGRFRPLLTRVPVKVILDDGCALVGAARLAVQARDPSRPRGPGPR